jgi:antitoxin component YwqK of YwqJK toxin-antitoxin module
VLRINADELELTDDGLTRLYEGKPFTGVAFENNAKGVLIDEAAYIDGQLSGTARLWSDSGVLISERSLTSNAAHGVSREWYRSGALKRVSEHELGILLKRTTYAENGEVTEQYLLKETDPWYSTLQTLRKGALAQAASELEARRRSER